MRSATSTPPSCSRRSTPSRTRRPTWHWRLLVAHRFGHAAAAETVKGTLALLDREGIDGELIVRDVHEGRAEIVQMWGRPESVRQDFRRRRSL